MSDTTVDLRLSRRKLLQTGGATTLAGSTGMLGAAAAALVPSEAQLKELEKQG